MMDEPDDGDDFRHERQPRASSSDELEYLDVSVVPAARNANDDNGETQEAFDDRQMYSSRDSPGLEANINEDGHAFGGEALGDTSRDDTHGNAAHGDVDGTD